MNTQHWEQGYSAADVVADFRGQKLGFDDIDVSGGGGIVEMPPGYGGLTWSNGWDVLKPSEENPDDPKSGYFTGITSGDQVAFNANAGRVEISAQSFNLKSVELTAAWDKELFVQIVAYRGDRVALDHTISINDHSPTLVEFDLKGISDIIFIPGYEKHDKHSSGSGPFMVFDDLKVSNVQSLESKPLSQHHSPSYATGTFAADGPFGTAHLDLSHHQIAIA